MPESNIQYGALPSGGQAVTTQVDITQPIVDTQPTSKSSGKTAEGKDVKDAGDANPELTKLKKDRQHDHLMMALCSAGQCGFSAITSAALFSIAAASHFTSPIGLVSAACLGYSLGMGEMAVVETWKSGS
jgi:hypothetical protein